jgi:hypothetical protein
MSKVTVMKKRFIWSAFFLIGILCGTAVLWFTALYIYLLVMNDVSDSSSNLFELNVLSISFWFSFILIMVSTIISAELKGIFEWSGLFKSNELTKKLCRWSILCSFVNFFVLFLCLFILRKFYFQTNLDSYKERWAVTLFASINIFLSIVIFSYSFFGVSAVMSRRVQKYWKQPFSFLSSKWRKSD